MARKRSMPPNRERRRKQTVREAHEQKAAAAKDRETAKPQKKADLLSKHEKAKQRQEKAKQEA
jgi:hypothetical protein